MSTVHLRPAERAAREELHKKVHDAEVASGVTPTQWLDEKPGTKTGVTIDPSDADTEYGDSVGVGTWSTSDQSYRVGDFSGPAASMPVTKIPSVVHEEDEASPKEAAEAQATEDAKISGRVPTKSAGSIMHGTGECRPCAWFWKPQGCQNAEDCRHCHMCPEGEIKLRKKQKVDVLKKEAEDNQGDAVGEDALPIGAPPGLAEPSNASATKKETKLVIAQPGELPSEGSVLHGTGECRPCAWFWKPQGCENDKECRHCHLCPEGEIRNRKKVKVDHLRQEKQAEEESKAHLQAAQMQAAANAFCAPFLPMPVPLLPSLGSTLHGTGMCRPCAWFWKSQGCENGMECRHCHLCLEGEIKGRRKMKVAVLRTHGAMMEMQLEQAQAMLKQHQDTWGDVEQQQWEEDCAAGFYQNHSETVADLTPATVKHNGISPTTLGNKDVGSPAWVEVETSSPKDGDTGTTSEFFGSTSPKTVEISSAATGDLPSVGSALHPSQCRPCAWFWKSQGCHNAQACAHCHLCPEGELKARKRVKESSMRQGADTTTKRNDVRSPRVVNIAPTLGA